MIIWTGKGILSVLVVIGVLFISIKVLPEDYADYTFVIAFFAGGLFSWVYGEKWNNQKEEIFIDPQTGEKSLVNNNHTLFWVPMQYWGIVFPVLGILMLSQSSIWMTVVCSLVLLAIIGAQYIKSANSTNGTHKPKVVPSQKASPLIPKTEETKETEAERLKRRQEKEDPNRFMPK